jgi:hypothetical protein
MHSVPLRGQQALYSVYYIATHNLQRTVLVLSGKDASWCCIAVQAYTTVSKSATLQSLLQRATDRLLPNWSTARVLHHLSLRVLRRTLPHTC